MQDKLINFWYSQSYWRWVLLPCHLILRILIILRSVLYRMGWFKSITLPVPVWVVGNITVGGTGKTPFVIWLVEALKKRNVRVGIVSRGYGGYSDHYPLMITDETPIYVSGDEPALLYRRLKVPVVIDPKRARAAQWLLENNDVDIIISDDGLQHYALQRQTEIAIIDGQRKLGNRLLIPLGPLREPVSRLKKVDCVLEQVNKDTQVIMDLNQLQKKYFVIQPTAWVNVKTGERQSIHQAVFKSCETIEAICGIGNPKKFESSLQNLGINYHLTVYPDHHAFNEKELIQYHNETLIMTEKDAQKCRDFAKDDWWYLEIDIELSHDAVQCIDTLIEEFKARDSN